MIPRYSRKDAADVWSPQTRFRIMFEIGAHAADAMAELGVIPSEAARVIWERGRDAIWSAARVAELEREGTDEVTAFLAHVTEIVGPEARFLHQGMTSADVSDTALAVQLTRATDLLMEDVELVLAALKRRAFEHKLTPAPGRGDPPISVGLTLAGHYAAFTRARERLAMARFEIATCAIAGAGGTFADVAPQVEAYVADHMGLVVEPISTQGVPRDHHAAYVAGLAVVASSVERLAAEIHHLKGADHPPATEDLAGLTRLVCAAVTPALENVALSDERRASPGVEQSAAADATVHLDFALRGVADAVERLVVPDADVAHLDLSHRVQHVDRLFARVFGDQA